LVSDPISVALRVAEALEACGVRYLVGGSPLGETQMSRRQRFRIATDPDRFLYVYTAEDILLQKLRWYRMGEEVSERQWRDILGIILVQGSALDEEYLRKGASVLGVTDLLDRALDQAQNTKL
jgi:hypothetical protein